MIIIGIPMIISLWSIAPVYKAKGGIVELYKNIS